jgi:hypothetical protein
MGNCMTTVQEIRLPAETPLQRAKTRHDEVLRICEHLVAAMHAWGRLGKLCAMVERDHDWELLGYESFGSWMMAVENHTGYSRASAYAYKKLFEELEPWSDDLEGMSLGTAQVFKLLPAGLQRSAEVRSDAKRMKPKAFREKIAMDHPESHIETRESVCLNLDASLYQLWREAIDGARALEDDVCLTHEVVFEKILVDWLEWNRPRIQEKQK